MGKKDESGHQGDGSRGEQDITVTTTETRDGDLQTDFFYGGQGSSGGPGHGHTAIDEQGNEQTHEAPTNPGR